MSEPFVEFPKIARFSRECIITEKIDGTNAQICIEQEALRLSTLDGSEPPVTASHDGLVFYAGSRTKWITPENDNHGFARWVREHAAELAALGPGRHFGEWWGQGIQRGYGLKEKRFSLFNVERWQDLRPACCHVIPILWWGPFDRAPVTEILELLRANGSYAAPGFMRPEGVVVFHIAGNVAFKKTLEKDDEPKSKLAARGEGEA